MLALEGGLVRRVRRVSGGVPRSSAGGDSDSAAAAVEAVTRRGLQLQSISPRPESRRPPPSLERQPQLAIHPGPTATDTGPLEDTE
jgi:hypothetical protein